jgi:hypothetical protein
MVSRYRLAAAILVFIGALIGPAHPAWPQSCKQQDQTSCTQWWWNEVTGGIPPHVTCANGLMTCIPIILVDLNINGYKFAAWGWHTLAIAGPSPGRARYRAVSGCTCDPATGECVCVYSSVITNINCPDLANPNTSPDCP